MGVCVLDFFSSIYVFLVFTFVALLCMCLCVFFVITSIFFQFCAPSIIYYFFFFFASSLTYSFFCKFSLFRNYLMYVWVCLRVRFFVLLLPRGHIFAACLFLFVLFGFCGVSRISMPMISSSLWLAKAVSSMSVSRFCLYVLFVVVHPFLHSPTFSINQSPPWVVAQWGFTNHDCCTTLALPLLLLAGFVCFCCCFFFGNHFSTLWYF